MKLKITLTLFETSEAVRSSDDCIVDAKSLYIYLVTDMIWQVIAFTVFSLRDDGDEDGDYDNQEFLINEGDISLAAAGLMEK